ncbi:hypothetical protein C6496_16130 [Candidatus Poribacteria bacterium]|nr:MAG: hypothetical protein C6496_16130 [Candidatus Poribacteria bacterium]
MRNSYLTQPVFNKHARYFLIPIMSLLLITIYIPGCGGDSDEESASSTSIVSTPPATTSTATTTPPPVAVAEAEPEEVGISFQNDILPILAENCALGGCHVAGGAAGLDLTGYDSFEKSGVFVPGNAKKSRVITRIDGGGMPPAGPLDDDLIDLVKDWIDEGAEDN